MSKSKVETTAQQSSVSKAARSFRNTRWQGFRSWWGRCKGYGGCYRCGATWDWAKSHETPYESGSACFSLCSRCWTSLTPQSRMPYYDALVNEWTRQLPEYAVEYDRKRDLIRKAVLAGG